MKLRSTKCLVIYSSLSLWLFAGCDKAKLDLKPHGPTEQTYFSTEGEFTKSVLGVYAKLSDYYGFVTVSYSTGPGAMLMPIYLLPGDDITTNNSNEEFEQFGPLQPSSGRLGDFYKTSYQLIARANVVLQKTDEENGIYTTAGLKDTHRGEALFLRGFAYYYLWNYFGTAPLNTARVTSPDQFTPPSTEGTQLLDQAIADFQQAAELLANTTWDEANRGRATRNSALGFLGKCLVFRATVNNNTADYTAAIAAFNQVNGVSLVAKYDDNFAYDTENNAESLFEYQAAQPSGSNNMWLPNDFDNPIGNLTIAWNYYNNKELYGMSQFFATSKLLNTFEDGDPRKDLTTKSADRSISKYTTRDMAAHGWQNASVNNYRLLRYADVLLLKAEAILGSGGSTDEAISLINQVRERARTMGGGTAPAARPAGANAETVFQWIVDERLIELGGEGQRWPDLRRWQMGGKISLSSDYFNSNTSTISFQLPKHLNFPIPNIEIDQNPNVKQNTGY